MVFLNTQQVLRGVGGMDTDLHTKGTSFPRFSPSTLTPQTIPWLKLSAGGRDGKGIRDRKGRTKELLPEHHQGVFSLDFHSC